MEGHMKVTTINVSGIQLVIGDDPLLRIESPFSNADTVRRLRAAAFLLENKSKIEEISPPETVS